MLKKAFSVVMVLMMLVCMALPVSAVDETDTLSDKQALEAATVGVAALVAEEDDDVTLDEGLAEEIIGDADTAEAISRAIAQFVFIEKSKVGELSDAIVADSKYTVTVTADGKDTVYIAVSIIDHPEIYDARVFLSVVKKLAEKSNEVAIENGIDVDSENYNPMMYTHIAGELSLHMITMDITGFLGGDSWNILLKDFYEKAIVADLNIDESRLPSFFIEFWGNFLVILFEVLFA